MIYIVIEMTDSIKSDRHVWKRIYFFFCLSYGEITSEYFWKKKNEKY